MRRETFHKLNIGEYLVCKDGGLYQIAGFFAGFYSLTPISKIDYPYHTLQECFCYLFNRAKPRDKVKFL